MAASAPDGAGLGCTQFAFCRTTHMMTIAIMNLYGRITGAPASTGLSCPASVPLKGSIRAMTETSVTGGTSLVDFISPSHKHVTEVATFDPASGLSEASFTPRQKGTWTVAARWGGDDAHAPVEATPCTVNVGAPADG